MSYAIDVRCLKGMYKQCGALPIFVRDRKGIEKPGKFVPLHSFFEGYYWNVMTIDDLDDEDKKCTIIGGPNDGKCPYPRGYKQDTLEFVETNTWADFDSCIVYCNGRLGPNAPCFTEVNVYDDKVVFFENTERILEWQAKWLKEQEEQKKKKAERGSFCNYGNEAISLPMVRKAYPKLFSEVLMDVKPKEQSESSYYKLKYTDGTEKTDGVLSWARKKKQ